MASKASGEGDERKRTKIMEEMIEKESNDQCLARE